MAEGVHIADLDDRGNPATQSMRRRRPWRPGRRGSVPRRYGSASPRPTHAGVSRRVLAQRRGLTIAIRRVILDAVAAVPKEQRCFVEVVRPAPQLNVAHRRGAAGRVGLDVMKLEESGFLTPARGPDERTPACIPLPDLAPDHSRNVSRRRLRGLRRPRPRGLRISPTLEFGEQDRERAAPPWLAARWLRVASLRSAGHHPPCGRERCANSYSFVARAFFEVLRSRRLRDRRALVRLSRTRRELRAQRNVVGWRYASNAVAIEPDPCRRICQEECC